MKLNSLETEMANFDFDQLSAQNETAKADIASAANADDIKAAICKVWSKIGKYVKLADVIPVAGKFITILADLLDSLCAG
jgi:hypothetical protein